MNVKHLIAALPLAGLFACATHPEPDMQLRADAAALFGRIEAASTPATPEIELGRALFWDTRLSADGKTACASCHPALAWGADPRRFSPDARAELTSRQSPTIFNASMQPALRWLGDRKDLQQQAEGSLTGSMGFATKDAAVMRMNELRYETAFKAAYPALEKPVSASATGEIPANYAAPGQPYVESLWLQ